MKNLRGASACSVRRKTLLYKEHIVHCNMYAYMGCYEVRALLTHCFMDMGRLMHWIVDTPVRLLREKIPVGWNLFCSAPSPNNVICTICA